RQLNRVQKIVNHIEAMEPDMEKLSDSELQQKTEEFKDRYQNGETLDDILPEAYAVVREAAKRVLHMRPFNVQLVGGVVLREGKTLASALPAYLNALTGDGVHIITVNEYLAERDASEMGQLHEFLGLTVGLNVNSKSKEEKREAYECDITYGTNNEFGFDYL